VAQDVGDQLVLPGDERAPRRRTQRRGKRGRVVLLPRRLQSEPQPRGQRGHRLRGAFAPLLRIGRDEARRAPETRTHGHRALRRARIEQPHEGAGAGPPGDGERLGILRAVGLHAERSPGCRRFLRMSDEHDQRRAVGRSGCRGRAFGRRHGARRHRGVRRERQRRCRPHARGQEGSSRECVARLPTFVHVFLLRSCSPIVTRRSAPTPRTEHVHRACWRNAQQPHGTRGRKRCSRRRAHRRSGPRFGPAPPRAQGARQPRSAAVCAGSGRPGPTARSSRAGRTARRSPSR